MYFPRVFIFNTSIIAIINSILINNIMIILGAIMIVIKMKEKKKSRNSRNLVRKGSQVGQGIGILVTNHFWSH